MVLAVRPGHLGAHRLGILLAEMEDMADLDAARREPVAIRDVGPGRFVMHLVGGGVGRRPFLHDAADLGIVGEIRVRARHVKRQIGAVAEHLALACLGQDDELMAEVAADRAGIGAHRNGLQAHTRERPEI